VKKHIRVYSPPPLYIFITIIWVWELVLPLLEVVVWLRAAVGRNSLEERQEVCPKSADDGGFCLETRALHPILLILGSHWGGERCWGVSGLSSICSACRRGGEPAGLALS